MSGKRTLGVVRPIASIDRGEVLEALDNLRAAIERGDVTCFVAVGIDKEDGTRVWTGNSHPRKSALQVQGAISQLFLTFWDWAEFNDEPGSAS